MQTLDFETLTFEQLNQWAEKESEIFEKLARLLKGASDNEKLRIAAIAILGAQTYPKNSNITHRIQSCVETAFLRNTSLITNECSRLIESLPFSDGKLRLANFIIERFREDSEEDISEPAEQITDADTFDLAETGDEDYIPY
ncbi:hypothetical protein PN499_26650 [Kamptonema animale CS-326]|jgi:hypothetical protein|uniref:hypothetical protein n=1 Tax=Kamptonema animale TaxID=92934 RepID=UPI00232FBC3B|nr:hypothetical protein [Kamptonema animale]MDB9514788.1 hypothetical protein [Kamptonema animale CS-326]